MSNSSYTASLRNSRNSDYFPTEQYRDEISDCRSIYSYNTQFRPRFKLPSFNATAVNSSNRYGTLSTKAATGKQINNNFSGKPQDKFLERLVQILFFPFFFPFPDTSKKYCAEDSSASPELRQKMLQFLPMLDEMIKFCGQFTSCSKALPSLPTQLAKSEKEAS